MMKAIALLKGKPDLPHEDFVRYYATCHMALMHSILAETLEYRRNYLQIQGAFPYEGASGPGFDVLGLGGFGTHGGLRADGAARVLRESDETIPGISAASNTSAVLLPTYPGAGLDALSRDGICQSDGLRPGRRPRSGSMTVEDSA